MKVVGKDDVTDMIKRTLFTVELEHGKYVDVMAVFHSKEKPLIYVMQNGDGSMVYGEKGTHPDYVYDEKEVIELIKAFLRKE